MSEQGRRDLWTSWFDRFAFERQTHCLYPNLPLGQALVVNHAGPGLHYKGEKGDDAKLVDPSIHWVAHKLFYIPPSPRVIDFTGEATERHLAPTHTESVHVSVEAQGQRDLPTPSSSCDSFQSSELDMLAGELHPFDNVLHVHQSHAGEENILEEAEHPCTDLSQAGARHVPGLSDHSNGTFASYVRAWYFMGIDSMGDKEPSIPTTNAPWDVVLLTGIVDLDAMRYLQQVVEGQGHATARFIMLKAPWEDVLAFRRVLDSRTRGASKLALQMSHVFQSKVTGKANAVFQPWLISAQGEVAVELHVLMLEGVAHEVHPQLHGMIQDLRES